MQLVPHTYRIFASTWLTVYLFITPLIILAHMYSESIYLWDIKHYQVDLIYAGSTSASLSVPQEVNTLWKCLY